MATNAAPLSGQARRLAAAALIVVVVAVSVWLFGRPERSEPAVQVVATAEDWAARREPGQFVTVEMPEKTAALFVTPAELAGRVPAVAVPAGTVLSESLLAGPGTGSAADPSAALLAVAVDPSLWPDPGPATGAVAVLAAEPGGCAAAVMPIVAAGDGSVVVEAGPELAARLGPAVWWIWEAPAAGWPGCPDGAAYTVVHLGG
ncbi:MAG: hypothetical protein F4Z00_17480 [Acidimicrobiaceae bacterium]|nr:hypothetical protein [Acidimicrobiaceae bacterium]MXY09952.1 hypothetical protein [Acidimicrobiaceae bacterium]MXZ67320.1 hypothetical protein [Acidimicrobiaceae bacterium]MYF33881.1 hypothetical protein [Acidimicrobiaceae bacterium]MYG80230.1 hypothetical protein [Acidimicrobiaceae bacterium]